MSNVITTTQVGVLHLQAEKSQPQSLEGREAALLDALSRLDFFNEKELAKLVEAQGLLKARPSLALTYAFLYVARAAIMRHGYDVQESLVALAEQFIPIIQERLSPRRDALVYIREVQVHVVSAQALFREALDLQQQRDRLLVDAEAADRAIDASRAAMHEAYATLFERRQASVVQVNAIDHEASATRAAVTHVAHRAARIAERLKNSNQRLQKTLN